MAGIVTYAFPVAGSSPPSVALMKKHQLLTAQVSFLDTDTTAVITHNWQSPLSDLSSLFPLISFYNASNGGTGVNAAITWAHTDSSNITLTKTAAAGSEGTINVQLARPFSEIR